MKRPLILLLIVAGFLATASHPTEAARRRGPRKPAEHYTYEPGHLADKLSRYRGAFDRVVLLNHGEVTLLDAKPLCDTRWTARRVIAWLGDPEDFPGIALRLPEGATVVSTAMYLIDPDGQIARKIEEPVLTISEDTLWVQPTEGLDDTYVVEALADFTGTNLVIRERIVFQEEWPVLQAEYFFGVAKDLLEENMKSGHNWVFRSTTYPDRWDARRADTEKLFRWFWRESAIEPPTLGESEYGARAVEIVDYLPVPLLGRYDLEELPELDSRESIERLKKELHQIFNEEELASAREGSQGVIGREGHQDLGTVRPGKQSGDR